MNIKILGTRGEGQPNSPYHSKYSGILIDGKILFDIGEKKYLQYKPKKIFITHLHPDHAYFVRKKTKNTIPSKTPVFAPEKHPKAKTINIVKPEKKIKIKDYNIIPIPTHHSKKVESTAYIIQKEEDKKILYTGDMIWINKEYRHYFKNLDLVITEASFLRKKGRIRRDKKTGKIYGHTGVPDLINIFKEYTDKIVLTHFGLWFYKDIKKARDRIKKIGEKNKIKIIVGYDGKKLKI
ncbi:MAG: MBL fold metallo-hydrolase [Candidatus Thermoplasmatota archaeon]